MSNATQQDTFEASFHLISLHHFIACYIPVVLSVGAAMAGYAQAQGTIKEARLLLSCTMWLVDRLLSIF